MYIKTPDGGFYVNNENFIVDYEQNKVDIKNTTGITGNYLTLDGGRMKAGATISGTDTLEISLVNKDVSSVLGLSPEGLTISNETNDIPTSSIRVIHEIIEIKGNDTTVTVNGNGVTLNGANLIGVGSIVGNDNEIAIENDIDMNNHKISGIADATEPNDVLNKKVADASYATKSEIQNFITNDELPQLATTIVAGIVKQGENVPKSIGASDTVLENTVNALIDSLINAGIIASS